MDELATGMPLASPPTHGVGAFDIPLLSLEFGILVPDGGHALPELVNRVLEL